MLAGIGEPGAAAGLPSPGAGTGLGAASGSVALTSCPHPSPTGVRTEQDLYVRLIDSVTKQVSGHRSPLLSGTPDPPAPHLPPHPYPPRLPGSDFTCLSTSTSTLSNLESHFFPFSPPCPLSFWLGLGIGEQRGEERKQLVGDPILPNVPFCRKYVLTRANFSIILSLELIRPQLRFCANS